VLETGDRNSAVTTQLDRGGVALGRWGRRQYDVVMARVLAPPVWPRALVLLAVLAGAILRLVDLHGVPPGLHQDEAIYAYDAYSLAMTGRDHLGHPFNLVGFEAFGEWAPPLLILIEAPFVGLFGLHVELVRAITALICVAGVPIVYLLGCLLTDRRSVGVIAAWLLAVSPWSVHQSRWATSPSIAPTMVGLSLLLVLWTLKNRSEQGLIWTSIAMALTLASSFSLRLYVPLMLLGTLPWFWRVYLRFRLKTLAISLAIGSYVVVPALWFALLDPAGGGRLKQVSIFTKPSIYLPPGTKIDLQFLWRQYHAYFSVRFLWTHGNGTLDSPPGGGVELRALMPFFIIGVVVLSWTVLSRGVGLLRKMAGSFLAALVFLPIPAAITLPTPAVERITHAVLFLAIVDAVGAVAVWDLAKLLARRHWRLGNVVWITPLAALVIAIAAIGVELDHRYNAYFVDYAVAGEPNFAYGVESSVQYALAQANQYDQVYMSGMPEPYAFVLFYGQWDPADVHARLKVDRNPPWFNSVASFDHYVFEDAPPEVVNQLPIIKRVAGSDGAVAFELRGGVTADGKRVLIIRRPPT